LRKAMDDVAMFKEVPVPKEEELQEGVKERRRFRSRLWELDLMLEADKKSRSGLAISEKSTIKNVHPSGRTQTLANPRSQPPRGVFFRLAEKSNRKAYYNLEVAGEPVPYGKGAPLRNI